jgi:DegV family protein with EDD domain
MKDYVIVTDSTADLTVSLIEECQVKVIPMFFEIANNNYCDEPAHEALSIKEFYDLLRAGKTSTTTLINAARFKAFFEEIISEGKDIIYIAFSSALSGSYQASLTAAKELLQQYPLTRIECIDSRAASGGEGLLVYTAAQKKAGGYSFEMLKDWLLDQRDHLCQWFTVDDLNHLKRGGRINAATATIGTALNVKPVLHVDNEGHLIPRYKVRGRKKALHSLLDQMIETCVNPQDNNVFISHGDSVEDAGYLEDMIRKQLPVKDVKIMPIGPIVGSHSGPGTIALFYFGSEK